ADPGGLIGFGRRQNAVAPPLEHVREDVNATDVVFDNQGRWHPEEWATTRRHLPCRMRRPLGAMRRGRRGFRSAHGTEARVAGGVEPHGRSVMIPPAV